MIERGGKVVIRMLENVQQLTIEPIIKATITKGATVYTDEYGIYNALENWGYERLFVMVQESMPVTTTKTAFARYMSTRWKDFGRFYVPGYGLTGASHRRNCRSIWAFLSLSTMPKNEVKLC